MADQPAWLAAVNFNPQGLVSVTTIDATDGTLLMQAWANAEALQLTVARGEMVYFSRSRGRLWHKGEQSGHVQKVVRLLLDCDGDAIVAEVRQKGGIACHTGRKSCFYRQLIHGDWQHDPAQPILKTEAEIYDKP